MQRSNTPQDILNNESLRELSDGNPLYFIKLPLKDAWLLCMALSRVAATGFPVEESLGMLVGLELAANLSEGLQRSNLSLSASAFLLRSQLEKVDLSAIEHRLNAWREGRSE